MAAPSGQVKPSRYFIPLGLLIILLYALVFFAGSAATPKLGLDLQGGTSLTLSANKIQGGAPVSQQNLEIARQIIENRVNSLGVASTNVVVEGDDIVVSVPGKVANREQLEQLSTQAKLEFRLVTGGAPDQAATYCAPASPSPSTSGSPSPGNSASPAASGSAAPAPSASAAAATSSATATPAASAATPSATATTPASTPSANPSPAPSPSSTEAPDTAATGEGITPLDQVKAKLGTDLYNQAAQVTDPSQVTDPTEFAAFCKLSPADVAALPPTMQYAIPNITCAQLDKRVPGVITTDEAIKSQVVACEDAVGKPTDTNYIPETKYLLDEAKVHGEQISSVNSGYQGGGNGQPALGWVVNLTFNNGGSSAWANLTSTAYNNAQAAGTTAQVAIVLDNLVVTAPTIQGALTGPTQIYGSFTQDSAKLLQTQLSYGSLPISFTPQTVETVSATLGLAQLKAGLLAGGIGLALVVLYCLFYYRALGLVVIASLLVSGAIVYSSIVLLGRGIDFALTLAGVAGFIVAIGITADSFVVFFERLKDEVRDGKSGRSAVPKAWIRARRTILSADAVSFLAAAVLYWLAGGDVRGFAFTLGLSTIIDLVVVFLFTHPLVSVLSGFRTFTSPRFSGLGDVRGRRRSGARSSRLAPKES